jgi:hypothetical protein
VALAEVRRVQVVYSFRSCELARHVFERATTTFVTLTDATSRPSSSTIARRSPTCSSGSYSSYVLRQLSGRGTLVAVDDEVDQLSPHRAGRPELDGP